MNCLSDINWFAVHSKRFREVIAATSVRALGLETFLPLVRIDYRPDVVIKVESKPLFPGYFFARFCPANSLDAVQSARSVLKVIKSGSYPIPVEGDVIAEIQERVEADGLIRLKRDAFKPGDRVSIQKGAFAGMFGRVEAEADDRMRVAILLETLWNARVVIEKQWIEVAA